VLGADGPGRRLFRCGDRDSLVAALRASLGDHPADRLEAAAFGDELADRYSWDVVTDATETLYEQVCRTRRRVALPDVYAEAMAARADLATPAREDIPA
jgi:hypothetical protein